MGARTLQHTGWGHLVLALHEKVQQRIRVNHGLAEVGHHADKVRVPFVGNLGESGRT